MCDWLMMLAMLLIVLSMLAGCANTTKTSDSLCLIDHPVTWSKSDTDQTIREIKVHNARYRAVCSPKKNG
jgi:ABC-type uncharacterized transport system auxiliary subunit